MPTPGSLASVCRTDHGVVNAQRGSVITVAGLVIHRQSILWVQLSCRPFCVPERHIIVEEMPCNHTQVEWPMPLLVPRRAAIFLLNFAPVARIGHTKHGQICCENGRACRHAIGSISPQRLLSPFRSRHGRLGLNVTLPAFESQACVGRCRCALSSATYSLN